MARGRRGSRAVAPAGAWAMLGGDVTGGDPARHDPADLRARMDAAWVRMAADGRLGEAYRGVVESARWCAAHDVVLADGIADIDPGRAERWGLQPAEAAAARVCAGLPALAEVFPRCAGRPGEGMAVAFLTAGAVVLRDRVGADCASGSAYATTRWGTPVREEGVLRAPLRWLEPLAGPDALARRLRLWDRVRGGGAAGADHLTFTTRTPLRLYDMAEWLEQGEVPVCWWNGSLVWWDDLLVCAGRVCRLTLVAPDHDGARTELRALRGARVRDAHTPPPDPTHPWRLLGDDALTNPRRVSRRDLGIVDACIHSRAEWDRNTTDTAIVLRCGTCGRERIAAIPRHRLPAGHPATLGVGEREAYTRRLAAIAACAGHQAPDIDSDPPVAQAMLAPRAYAVGARGRTGSRRHADPEAQLAPARRTRGGL